MSKRRGEGGPWLHVSMLLIAYLVVISIIWGLAVWIRDERLQAAMFGLGATVTVAVTSLVGGELSSAWTSARQLEREHIQQVREHVERRRATLEDVLTAVNVYDSHRTAAHKCWVAQGNPEQKGRASVNERLMREMELVYTTKLQVEIALERAKRLVVDESPAAIGLSELAEALRCQKMSPTVVVVPLPTEQVLAEIRQGLSG